MKHFQKNPLKTSVAQFFFELRSLKYLLVPGIQIFLCLFLLSACGEGQIFEDPSVKATRESSERYAAQTMQFIETQIPTVIALNATVQAIPAMGTQYAQLEQQNRSLQATLRAMDNGQPAPPAPGGQTVPTASGLTTGQQTASTMPAQAPLSSAQSEIFNPNTQNVTVSSGVKEADGCATDSRSAFTVTGETDTIRIYLTAVALNVEEGMVFSSRWTNSAGTQYETSSWTADGTYDSTCIYFWISSADLSYTSGDWKAELLINSEPAAQTIFKLCQTGQSC